MKQRFIFIFLLAFMLMHVHALSAQTPSEPGLDMVFIVDQSGSMSRGAIEQNSCAPNCRLPASDPDNIALQSLPAAVDPIFGKLLIRELGRTNKALYPEINRMGVVLFGDGATTSVPMTEIKTVTNPTTGQQEANIISQLPTQNSVMGDTSFSNAFREACNLLDCNNPMPADRKRVIVLLTDGAPFDRAIDPNLDGRPYFDILKNQVAPLVNDPNTKLWVLGIDKNNLFWTKNQPYWEELAPQRTQRLNNPTEASALFRQIAADEIGEIGESKTCDKSAIKIDPYRSSLYLVLNYENADTTAYFYTPTGEKLTADNPIVVNHTRTSLTESFTIKNPEPGDWRCEQVGDYIQTAFKTLQGDFKTANVSALTINSNQDPSTCEPFNFTVQYEDADKQILSELANYPLVQEATITIDGKDEKRVMILDGPDRNTWRTQAPVQPSLAGGEYPINFIVQLQNGTQLFSTKSSVIIKPDLPCIQVESPVAGASLPLHNKLTELPVDVRVKLTQGGVPKTPNGVFKEDITKILSGTVQMSDGRTESFALTPSKEDGIFTARLNTLKTTGTYTINVALNGTSATTNNPYRLTPPANMFSRPEDPTYITIQRIITGAKIALGIITVLLFAWFLYLVTPPYPKGVVIVEQKSSDGMRWDAVRAYPMGRQKLFGLFRTKHPTIKGKQAPLITGIHKMKVRRVVKRRDVGVDLDATGSKKKPVVAGTFMRDDETKTFGKYRIRYEK